MANQESSVFLRVAEGGSDTSPEAREVWLDLLRKVPEGKKIAMVIEMNLFARRMAEVGVRMRYPAASGREVFLRVAALHLTREDMIRVYQWDPLEHGY
jgi:hypothetical protein